MAERCFIHEKIIPQVWTIDQFIINNNEWSDALSNWNNKYKISVIDYEKWTCVFKYQEEPNF